MKKLLRGLDKNRGFYFLTLFVGIVFSGVSVLSPTISGKMISAFSNDITKGYKYLALYIGIACVQIGMSVLDGYLGLSFARRQKWLMRKNSFRAFSKKANAGKESISDFTSFVNNDIPVVVEQYYSGSIDIIKCTLILALSAVAMLSVHYLLAIIVFGISALIVFCPGLTKKQAAKAREGYSDSLTIYNTGLASLLNGLKVIKTYNYHERANQIQEETNKNVSSSEKKIISSSMKIHSLNGLFQMGKTVLVIAVGIVLIIRGSIDVGGLLIVVQLEKLIAVPAEVLSYVIHSLNEAYPLVKSYEEILSEKGEGISLARVNGKVGNLSVDSLSYSIDSIQILKDVSIVFERGKKYLLTGESGSGKSTFLNIVAGIYDEDYTGRVYYDGIDIKAISRSEYYYHVATVFQEPYLFYASLNENICLGRRVSKEKYDEVIRKLNIGYLLERFGESDISAEIVEKLSGGEKQRIALARAMVGSPDVYLLDEVTSSLDKENAVLIERAIAEEDAMVIHICHKENESTKDLYDKKLVMLDGTIKMV